MDADVLQRAPVGRLTVRGFAPVLCALVFFLLTAQAQAAGCPPLLDAAFPTLSDDKPESICQYRGLVVLGFPSNDFGGQEPGSNREIAKFCEINYGVSFPLFSKTSVVKGSANPFYEKLAQATDSRPGWNFHKYLVDRRGAKALAFDTRVSPTDPKIVNEIERLLAEKGDSR